jgi:apolipoprotein N-acyltransferase
MWWAIGIGGVILYFLVLLTLGLMTLRRGHGWLFFFGIFFPLLWFIGAFLGPPRPAAA